MSTFTARARLAPAARWATSRGSLVGRSSGRRRFHDLGQDAAHVLRVDEEDERPMRADARLAEHPRTLGFELGLGGVDVGHLEADMVLPAERVLLEESHDRRALAERLDQLDLRIGSVDETHAHALRRKIEW